MKTSMKLTACLCAVLMSMSAVTAVCAADTAAAEQPAVTADADSKAPKAKNVKVGKVTAVNGSEITVSLGEFAAKQTDASAEKKEKPAKTKSSSSDTASAESGTETSKKQKPAGKSKVKSSDSTAAASEAAASENSTDTAKQKPAGKKGGKHKGGMRGEFTESGSTLTITVTDSIKLKNKGQTVSVSDISVGDLLILDYSDSGELTGINVTKAQTEKTKPENGTKTKGTSKTKTTAAEQSVSA